MKTKRVLTLFLLSFLLCVSLVPLALLGHDWKLLFVLPVYFSVTLYLLQKSPSQREKWITAFIMSIPPLLLMGPTHVLHFSETRFSLPSTLAHLAGISFAFVANELKKRIHFIFSGLLVLLATIAAFNMYPMWLHKINFGSFTGKVKYALPAPITGMVQNQHLLRNEDLLGKVLVLDFWHTKCGVCFREFPQLESLFKKYRNNASVRFFAVNKQLKTDTTGQAFAVLGKLNYSFPILMPSDKFFADKVGVEAYPTVLVIDKSGTVVFKGDLENAKDVVDDLLRNR